MANQLQLEVITPYRTILNEEVDAVTLPGIEGEIGVLPEHIPILTIVDSGILSFSANNKKQSIAVHWGYAQVEGNNVRVLVEQAETAIEINLERAKQAEKKAKDYLVTDKANITDLQDEEKRQQKFESKLKRSIVRQRLAQSL